MASLSSSEMTFTTKVWPVWTKERGGNDAPPVCRHQIVSLFPFGFMFGAPPGIPTNSPAGLTTAA